MINRFKEFRRFPKDRPSSSEDRKRTSAGHVKKAPALDLVMKPPEIPPGEDETSFKRHNKLLSIEYKKSKPNMAVVTSLMERTYAYRRIDILENSTDINEILSKYPFLQNLDQVRVSACNNYILNSFLSAGLYYCVLTFICVFNIRFFGKCSELCTWNSFSHL